MKTRTILLLLLPLCISYAMEKVLDRRVAQEATTRCAAHQYSSSEDYSRVLSQTKADHRSMYWLSRALFLGGSVVILVAVLKKHLKKQT